MDHYAVGTVLASKSKLTSFPAKFIVVAPSFNG